MIRDYDRYYGSVLSQLVERHGFAITFQRLGEFAHGFYLVDNANPLYIKYSTSRTGPWTFNFASEHLADVRRVVSQYGSCTIGLVCGKDGIAGVSVDDLATVVAIESKDQEALSIRRKRKQMYSLSGSKGNLGGKVGRDSLAEILLGDSFRSPNA